MVIREFFMKRSDGINLVITKSDQGLKLRKVGTDEIYDEAIDLEGTDFLYEETDSLVYGLENEV